MHQCIVMGPCYLIRTCRFFNGIWRWRPEKVGTWARSAATALTVVGARSASIERVPPMPIHLLGQPLQCFAGVEGDVGIVGVGEAVEVGPQQRQAFGGHDLDAFVNGAAVFRR